MIDTPFELHRLKALITECKNKNKPLPDVWFDCLLKFTESADEEIQKQAAELFVQYQSLLLKLLGKNIEDVEPQRARYFAHRPDDECYLASPCLQAVAEEDHERIHGLVSNGDGRGPDLYFGKPTKYDYRASYDTEGVGAAEKKGSRTNQEDRMSITSIREFERLTPGSQLQVISDTIGAMQTKHGKHETEGSCLISVISHPLPTQSEQPAKYRVFTSYLGDSVAYAIKLKAGKVSDCRRLNSHLHNPRPIEHANADTLVEARRLIAGGVPIYLDYGIYRVDFLAVSRSIGDASCQNISHEPEIEFEDITVEVGEEVIIVVACDGLTEKMSTEKIISHVTSQRKQSNDALAESLAIEALRQGSRDNVSVGVFRLSSKQSAKSEPSAKNAICVSVFDGHGGQKTSEGLRQDFAKTLQAKVDRQLCMQCHHQARVKQAQTTQELPYSFWSRRPALGDDASSPTLKRAYSMGRL